MRLKRNFTILIWLSVFIKDLKGKNLKIKDLIPYSTSLFRVVFCRMKYIGINTKWCTEWYWIEGDLDTTFVKNPLEPFENKKEGSERYGSRL